MEEKNKEVRTETAIIKFGSDRIFRVTFIKNTTLTLGNMKENQKIFEHLSSGGSYPFIFDAEENVEFTQEAKRFAFRKGCENIQVIAVVVNNVMHRQVAEYYYGANKPPVPYKVFSNFEEAHSWIRLYS